MTYDILLHLAYLFDPCEIQRHLNNPLNSGRRVPIICIFFLKFDLHVLQLALKTG